jgi:hypothetical protein
VRDFVERRVRGKVVDLISAISKTGLRHFTDGRLARHDACEALAAHLVVSKFICFAILFRLFIR